MAKLHDYYKDEVVNKLMTEFNYNSVMQVPRVEKITLNMGVGEAIADKKLLDNAAADLTAISGQKPLITKARKSVAGFKIRQGYPIGCKVTLRGERMWEFFERLITIAVPRIRDFRACPLSHSTVVVTTAWVSVSRSSSQKSTTIKSTAFVVWILPLPLLRNLTKKAVLCWLPLTSRSASKVGLLNG